MTRYTYALLVIAFALTPLISTRALAGVPAGSTHPAIQAAYEGLGAAFQAHDLDRFMTYFQPDYIDIDENGKHLTKEQTRQGYSAQLRQMKSIQSRYIVTDVQTTPSGTLVEMRLHSYGAGEKRILFAKIRGHFTDDLWVRDLWVNTPQGWRIQRRQTLKDDLSTGP
jgi:ketosteroid isomerase-like protein